MLSSRATPQEPTCKWKKTDNLLWQINLRKNMTFSQLLKKNHRKYRERRFTSPIRHRCNSLTKQETFSISYKHCMSSYWNTHIPRTEGQVPLLPAWIQLSVFPAAQGHVLAWVWFLSISARDEVSHFTFTRAGVRAQVSFHFDEGLNQPATVTK